MAKGIPIAGKKFAELRKERGYSQEKFVQLLEMSKGNVGRIEGLHLTGIHIDNVRIMAEKLNLTISELLVRIGANDQAARRSISAKPKRCAPK